jgi:hypothetical protein
LRLSAFTLVASMASGLVGCHAPPASPTNLTVTEDGTIDSATASWTNRCGDCQLRMQYRVAGGSFKDLQTASIDGPLLPPGTTRVGVVFQPEAPEAVHLGFRLRAEDAFDVSAWSPEVGYVRGVRPATGLTASPSAAGRITLAWASGSTAAAQLLLERRNAPDAPWQPLPVSFPATSFVDEDYLEFSEVDYRVGYALNGIWSRWALASVSPSPIRQPVDLRATLLPGAVALSWRTWSAAATEQVLWRWPGDAVAILSPGAEAGLDAEWPPWPSSIYWVEAQVSMSPFLPPRPPDLPTARLDPFQVTGAVTTFDARSVAMGGASAVSRDSSGAFHWIGFSAASWTMVVYSSGVGAAGGHVLAGGAVAAPGLLRDGAGALHAISYGVDGAGTAFWHDWLDASGWHSELLGLLSSQLVDGAWFGVDAVGEVQVLALRHVDSLSDVLVMGERTGGIFAFADQPLPTAGPWDLRPGFAVEADGRAWILGNQSSWLASRAPGGAWVSEPVPSELLGSSGLLRLSAAGRLAVVQTRPTAWPTVELRAAIRDASGWGPVTAFEAPGRYPGLSPVVSAAFSSDGARLSLVAESVDAVLVSGSRLDLHELLNGAWRSMRLAPSPGMAFHDYDASGRLWIVGWPRPGTDFGPVSVWEER